MTRRVTLTLALVVMAGLLASPVLGASEEATTAPDDEGEVSLLAVVSAASGSFDPDAEGQGTLTLDGVERATWFSDRPHRLVGVYSIEEMIADFFDDQEPPNAALETLEGVDETQDTVIVELSAPDYDTIARRLSFDARVLRPAEIEAELAC